MKRENLDTPEEKIVAALQSIARRGGIDFDLSPDVARSRHRDDLIAIGALDHPLDSFARVFELVETRPQGAAMMNALVAREGLNLGERRRIFMNERQLSLRTVIRYEQKGAQLMAAEFARIMNTDVGTGSYQFARSSDAVYLGLREEAQAVEAEGGSGLDFLIRKYASTYVEVVNMRFDVGRLQVMTDYQMEVISYLLGQLQYALNTVSPEHLSGSSGDELRRLERRALEHGWFTSNSEEA